MWRSLAGSPGPLLVPCLSQVTGPDLLSFEKGRVSPFSSARSYAMLLNLVACARRLCSEWLSEPDRGSWSFQMRFFSYVVPVLLALLAPSVPDGLSQQQASDNTLGHAEKEEGWVLLVQWKKP